VHAVAMSLHATQASVGLAAVTASGPAEWAAAQPCTTRGLVEGCPQVLGCHFLLQLCPDAGVRVEGPTWGRWQHPWGMSSCAGKSAWHQ
jgi:hypothetical protein